MTAAHPPTSALAGGRLPTASGTLSVREEALRAIVWLVLGALLAGGGGWWGGCASSSRLQQHLTNSAPCTASAPAPPQAPRSVYFDIGANNGDTITEFVAGHPLPDGELWDVVLIEATPRFTDQLLALCATLLEDGRVRSCLPLVETALTTYNGFVDIFVEEMRASHDASTIVQDSKITQGSGTHFNATALDIVTLFTDVFPVHPRDSVFVKIDIEGAEFLVIPRAIVHGMIPLWDSLDVEWHDQNPLFYGELREWYRGRHACFASVLGVEGLKLGTWGR
jgi:FkbM family methyltransferase